MNISRLLSLPFIVALTVLVQLALTAPSPSVLFVKSSITIDLHGDVNEWIVETSPDRILYITIQKTTSEPLMDLTPVEPFLTVFDGRDRKKILYSLPAHGESKPSFYSPRNVVIIRTNQLLLKKYVDQLKVEKAAPCPPNLDESSECRRINDPVSCYCATFANRTWEDTKAYCLENDMKFLAVESYEEDQAIWNTWGGQQALWIGASDLDEEGDFVWDATGGHLSGGYQNWETEQPSNGEPQVNYREHCVHYGYSRSSSVWNDCNCNGHWFCNGHYADKSFGGICELQP